MVCYSKNPDLKEREGRVRGQSDIMESVRLVDARVFVKFYLVSMMKEAMLLTDHANYKGKQHYARASLLQCRLDFVKMIRFSYLKNVSPEKSQISVYIFTQLGHFRDS